MAGLDASIGLSGLLASQRGMDVVGHNIANASTPGFTRQSVELVSANPTSHPVGQMGNGVRVAMVRQVADAFLDGRVRVAEGTQGYDHALAQRLGEIEGVLGDTSEGGLGGLLSGFFSAADALGVTPDDPSTRVTFLSSAARLAEGFQNTASFLEASRASVTGEVEGLIDEVNQLATQVADLNLAILNVEGSGQQANDLRDQRGVAARRLARLVGAQTTAQSSDGALKVTVAGRILVAGTRPRALEVQQDAAGNARIHFAGVASSLSLDGGEVGGLLAAQQETAGLVGQVDRLAQSVIREANRIHATGVPGSGPYTTLQTTLGAQDLDLSGDPGDDPLAAAGLGFAPGATTLTVNVTDPGGALSTTQIALDPAVDGLNALAAALTALPGLNASVSPSGLLTINAAAGFAFDFADRGGGDSDPGGVLAALGAAPLFQGSGAFDMAVAAGASPQALASGLGPGQSDGRNALRFSGIGRAEFAELEGESAQGFLAVIVSQAGQATKVAEDRSQASARVLEQLEGQREGVSGVSMEEEVANMIRFQRGFEAASRYLSVLNGLSDELMRMIG
ncbi:MAG: flagellar hook-associated protein FlgK [Planctomycetes bacterium]|nr:flagellar hook-associated protein FlgK [Planctomycetota bacterium]